MLAPSPNRSPNRTRRRPNPATQRILTGKQCRAARFSIGLLQHELAEAIGITQPSLSHFENFDNGLVEENVRKLRHELERRGADPVRGAPLADRRVAARSPGVPLKSPEPVPPRKARKRVWGEKPHGGPRMRTALYPQALKVITADGKRSVAAAARIMGVAAEHVTAGLRGDVHITIGLALKIEEAFGYSAIELLDKQVRIEVSKYRRDRS